VTSIGPVKGRTGLLNSTSSFPDETQAEDR
jgi:hypothetical protein